MTKTLETAFEAAKTLPDDRQDKLGQWVRDYVEQEQSHLALNEEQQREVRRRLSEPQPIFATDEQVAALFGKFAI